MTETQDTRYCEFLAAQNGLSKEDRTQSTDFQLWATQWVSYVKYGGDRPPIKPPRPEPQP